MTTENQSTDYTVKHTIEQIFYIIELLLSPRKEKKTIFSCKTNHYQCTEIALKAKKLGFNIDLIIIL